MKKAQWSKVDELEEAFLLQAFRSLLPCHLKLVVLLQLKPGKRGNLDTYFDNGKPWYALICDSQGVLNPSIVIYWEVVIEQRYFWIIFLFLVAPGWARIFLVALFAHRLQIHLTINCHCSSVFFPLSSKKFVIVIILRSPQRTLSWAPSECHMQSRQSGVCTKPCWED